VYALGCPYTCAYCTIQTIGRRPDYFGVDRVLAELRAYRDYYGRHHYVYWGDETFTLHKGRTLAICEALEREGDIRYDCQTRLNCIDDADLVGALARSGCRWIELGIETGLETSQRLYKQGTRLTRTEDVLRRIRDAGIGACSFMVVGFPTETLDDMRRSIDWVCSLIARDLLQASYLFGLVPYPGSVMFDDPERFGMRLRHRDFSQYNEDLPLVFDTSSARAEQVYDVFLDGLSDLGQAMAKTPCFGSAPPAGEVERYGAFWSASHV
jgi:radical SAM superfamily enzyme YgiQ (UPF0313 family)